MAGVPGWGPDDTPNDGYASEAELSIQKSIHISKKKKGGGFQSMGLSTPVFRAIMKKGYKVPTPIQRKVIPTVVEGKDVVAMARTGSGKTAAFLIPMFEHLKSRSGVSGARALIISPTRELALQTYKFTKELGCYTDLVTTVVLGGESMDSQFEAIHSNPDVIIATPGRFVHICMEMNLKFYTVEYLVFDEADRLFEMGFSDAIQDIVGRLKSEHQTLLFSATLPKMLVNFAKAGLSQPALIRLDVETKLPEGLRMAFFKCNSDDKVAILLYMMHCIIKPAEHTLIFVATKHHVEYLHMLFDLAGIKNTYSYSSLDATARKINVAKFRNKLVNCLIVTDVAARGIDIPLLDNVINFSFPAKSKLFVHRVGRVARAGRQGTAYSLVTEEEAPYLLDLHLFLSESIRFSPYPAQFQEGDCDKVYGSVPQDIIDIELDHLRHLHETSSDLENLKRTMNTAYKQYVKCRPTPSRESVQRMKEESWDRTLGPHPLFFRNKDSGNTDTRIELLQTLKTLRPKQTIFEVSRMPSSKEFQHMIQKRNRDERYIETFHKKKEERKLNKQELDAYKEVKLAVPTLEMSSEKDISETFHLGSLNGTTKVAAAKQTVIVDRNNQQEKKKMKIDGLGEKKKKTVYKQEEYFIPYTSQDRYTEEGYAIASKFDKEAKHAVLDLTQDDDEVLRKQNTQMKWDRKKKKFVGLHNSERRIKTDSGAWLAASYKSNVYQKWLKRSKHLQAEKAGMEDDDENTRLNRPDAPNKHYKGSRKKHPLLQSRKNKLTRKQLPKRELRTKQEILKYRKTKNKNRSRTTKMQARAKNKRHMKLKNLKKGHSLD